MSREDKAAVLQAMKKLKKSHKPEDSEQLQNSGSKGFKNDDEDGSIAESIINAVSNFKRNH